ncbi:MAG: hypothetical protein IJF10_05470, partial [Clostridia bacterium]|nr:hypothetical protein [Clostridia bacterium]
RSAKLWCALAVYSTRGNKPATAIVGTGVPDGPKSSDVPSVLCFLLLTKKWGVAVATSLCFSKFT